ncbi:MAG: hypothetical protein BEN18_07230 [Epulopiscium sp. Nuni2H_MBin001]|nr:MAG: hypothetical protein BEN18_07230 [Epulopiscium sp. Nuni2H_MBin001]
MLLIGDKFTQLNKEKLTIRKEHFTRLLEQCQTYFGQPMDEEHPQTSITYMGVAAANLSLAYRLTKQEQYLDEAKRWIFTACNYDCWGYGFLVDVDLSASWLLFGFGLSYDWIGDNLSTDERNIILNKLILQCHKIFNYGEENRGNCWSTDYWQNHNWINYTGILTAAYAILPKYPEAQTWIDAIEDNFAKVFEWMPHDGSNYEGTGYWRYAINFFLAAAEMIRQHSGKDFFKTPFLENTFYYRLYQSAPNWEENINFADVHDRRSSHSISAYYKFATEYNNGYAQWLAELVRKNFLFREAYQSKIFPGIMPEAFLEYIWYNPEIEPKEPFDLPLTRFFPDLGLAVIRSSWDRDAIHFSIKSSPAGGHAQWTKSWELDKENNWRTRSLTHYHVDFNSFILIAHDSNLAIDEGFHRTSKAKVHNMITVDNTGCVGEKIWENSSLADPQLFDLNCKGIYNVWKDVPEDATAEVLDFISQNGFTYYCANSHKFYYPEMKLVKNVRNVIYSEQGYFIMLDDLHSDLDHTYTWRLHSEQFAKKNKEGVYTIKNGKGALNIYPILPTDMVTNVEETVINEIMTPQRPNDVRNIVLKTLCMENNPRQNNVLFLNILEPISSFDDTKMSIDKIDGLVGVHITKGELVETFIYSEDVAVDTDDIKTDAIWVSVVRNGGKVVKYAIYKGTYLVVNSQQIYKSDKIETAFVTV